MADTKVLEAFAVRCAGSSPVPGTNWSEGVDRALTHGHAGFFYGFRHGRVGMNRAGEVFGAATVFHVRDDLADEFTGILTENLRAEDFVGLGVGDDFNIAVAGVVGEGAGVGGEVEFADVDGESLGLGGVFAETDGGDLGLGVDDGGHEVPIDVAVFAGDPFGDGDAVFLGFVGEHGTVDDVADGPYAGNGGLELGVYLNAFFVGERNAGGGEIEMVGEGAATDGDEDLVCGELENLAVALGGEDTFGETGYLGVALDFEALLLKEAGEVAGDVVVAGGGDLGRNSTMVTSEPRRAQTEPSSRPMAPPPTTTSFFGMDASVRASVLEITVSPSNFMNGSSTGAEPVAMTMFLAVMDWPPTVSVLAETKLASPVMTVTLRALARAATPPVSLATMPSFFLSMAVTSIETPSILMPCSAACFCTKTQCSEEARRALLGMQPTLRQVPPRVARLSMRATLRPSWAARKAHT